MSGGEVPTKGVQRLLESGSAAEALAAADALDAAGVALPAFLRLRLIRSAMRIGELEAAERHARSLSDQDRANEKARPTLAQLAFEMEDWDAALQIYRSLADALGWTKKFCQRVYLCLQRLEAGGDQIIPVLERWRANDPEDPAMLSALARQFAKDGRLDEAQATVCQRARVARLSEEEHGILLAAARSRNALSRELIDNAIHHHPDSGPFRGMGVQWYFAHGSPVTARAHLYEHVGTTGEGKAHGALFGAAAATIPYLGEKIGEALGGGLAAEPLSSQLTAMAEIIRGPIWSLRVAINAAERETPALFPFGAINSTVSRSTIAALCYMADVLLTTALQLDPGNGKALELAATNARDRDDPQAASAYRLLDDAATASARSRLRLSEDLLLAGREEQAIEVAAAALGIRPEPIRVDRLDAWEDAGRTREDLHDGETIEAEIEVCFDRVARTIPFAFTAEPIRLYSPNEVDLRDNQVLVNGRGQAVFAGPFTPYGSSLPSFPVLQRTVGLAVPVASGPTIEEPIICLGGAPVHYSHYFHAITQNLYRLPTLTAASLAQDRRIALHPSTPDWVFQLLDLIGLPRDRLLVLPTASAMRFLDCVLAEPANFFSAPSRPAVAKMREELDRRFDAPTSGKRRLFLTRLAVKNEGRRLVNEDELLRVAERYGFEPVEAASLAMRDQIALFRSADVICGPTGGALTNSLFAPALATIICLSPRETCRNYYPALAAACGQRFAWCLGSFVPEGRTSRFFPHVPYYVDPADFDLVLRHVLS